MAVVIYPRAPGIYSDVNTHNNDNINVLLKYIILRDIKAL